MSAAARNTAEVATGADTPGHHRSDRIIPAVHRSPAAAVLGVLGVGLLIAAVATGRPAIVAASAPLLVAAAGLGVRRTAEHLDIDVHVADARVIEGTTIDVVVRVTSPVAIRRLELVVRTDGVLRTEPLAVSVPADEPVTIDVVLETARWGVGRVDALVLRWRDPAADRTMVAQLPVEAVVQVLPAAPQVATPLRSVRTRNTAGNVASRELGEGIELAEVRQWAPGDRLRAVNWRASARHGGLWVTTRHPERSIDVVIVVDAVLPAALDHAVRAAMSIADTHLAARDRVAVVGVGSSLRWLPPGSGPLQRHRLIDHLITAQTFGADAWAGGTAVPHRGITPGAAVIGLSSLLDDRAAGILADLRRRGFDASSICIDLPADAPVADEDPELSAAVTGLWGAERDARLTDLAAGGVPVVRWAPDDPLESALRQLSALRAVRRRGGHR